MNEIAELLSARFASLYEPELKEEIAANGKIVSVAAGQLVQDKGAYIKTIPLVAKGAIRVMRDDDKGNEILLYYVMGGNTCAMSLTCCMSAEKSKIRAVAEEDTTMIVLPVHLVEEWMLMYQSWKNFIMLTYSARFEELLKTVDLLAFEQMDRRLLHYLEEKRQLSGSDILDVTHQEIALALNSSREAISRLLKKMENMDLVQLQRNRIKMLKPSDKLLF